MEEICTCEWQYVWHYMGPKRSMQERDCVLVKYDPECPHHADVFAAFKGPAR